MSIILMEKLTDKIAALPENGTYFSLEFFPPKTQMVLISLLLFRLPCSQNKQGFSNLQKRLERMSRALRPLFVTVTWGAGGSTAARSLELADICQRQLGLTTCLHLTCTNMGRKVVDQALEAAKTLGIRNILALRGDAPREHEYRLIEEGFEEQGEAESNEEFTWAVDLVRYIRSTHGDHFCIGVAAYPEGHTDESYPTEQDPIQDLPYLIEKVRAGADFIMTQLFYDVSAYLRFETMLREHESGVFADLPIIPGLMPIQSFDILKRTTKLSHSKLPPELLERLEGVKGDDEAVKQVGVDAISEIVNALQSRKVAGPRGFHFYTLNLEKAVGHILERCQLIPPPQGDEPADHDSDLPPLTMKNGTSNLNPTLTIESTSSRNAARRSLSMSSSSGHLAASSSLATTHGTGPLAREATWDDYPNGRFGDARSPAFAPTLSYSPSTLPIPLHLAPALWGTPATPSAITKLFTCHLSGNSPSQLPWSDSTSLSPETAIILPHLLALNSRRNWWTIASQPAVDGVASSDDIHGWGPAGGFVFQKPFVEFFLPAIDWHQILRPHLESCAHGQVSWYAGDCGSGFESSEGREAVHAVTWGMFPGREIVTATMVEEVSFRAWAEEAFGIWAEWARYIGSGAEASIGGSGNQDDSDAGEKIRAKRFLRDCMEGCWLVNVIGHEFRNGGNLWSLLLEAGEKRVEGRDTS